MKVEITQDILQPLSVQRNRRGLHGTTYTALVEPVLREHLRPKESFILIRLRGPDEAEWGKWNVVDYDHGETVDGIMCLAPAGTERELMDVCEAPKK